jgi:acetyltransferase EpsM
VLGYIDDNLQLIGKSYIGLSVLGTSERLEDKALSESGVILGVGCNQTRLRIARDCLDRSRSLPVIQHAHSWVSPSAICGAGTVIMANATVQTLCRIGIACIINTGASVDHDCILGDGVHIAPGVHLAGHVTVGSGTHIGIGASVIGGISIGNGCLIAAGAVVIRDVPDGQRVAGIPARPMK